MRVRVAASLVLVCLVTFATLATYAQSPSSTGSLSGTVHDANGKALRDVRVSVTGTPLGNESRSATSDARGAFTVSNLPAGAYRVSVSANGYASQSARVSVPMQGELRLALTPGGNLVVRTERASSDLMKLVLPSGEEYVRCQCNGIAEIRLTGTTTTIDHIAPGRYTMQVLDAEGRIKTTYPVTIEEGQTTIAEIHVPE